MPIHYATVVMRGENISLALAAPAAPIAARLRRYGRVTFWNFVYNSAETNIVIRKLYNYSSKGTSDVEPEAVGHIVSSG
mgnify:CR=1 FL=1